MNEGKNLLVFIMVINFIALIAVIIEIALVPFTPFIIGLNVILLPHLSQHLKELK